MSAATAMDGNNMAIKSARAGLFNTILHGSMHFHNYRDALAPAGGYSACVREILAEERRHALFQHADSLLDTTLPGHRFQSRHRLIDRLVAEAEGSVVHRHHPARAEVQESLGSVFRTSVHVTK